MSSRGTAGNFGASIEVEAFARARISELEALRTAVQNGRGNRRVHQQVGWHLRRRTLSHSSRRAPASIRAAHARELSVQGGSSAAAVAAGPRGAQRLRKHRAKARFLRAHRALRNARPSRLETHEWHAKRFRMAPIPGTGDGRGVRVAAMACADRGVRSAFRALSHGCIAHDASYLDVVAVRAGSCEALVATLGKALSAEDAAVVGSTPVVCGSRVARGLVAVEHVSRRAIAPVDVLFRPVKDSPVVWLWTHPAASAAVADVLRSGGTDYGAEVEVLRGEVLTFAVQGPRAGFVLGAVLVREDTPGTAWDVVRYARSPASAPACAVLSGEAIDPRSNFPPKRVRETAAAGAEAIQTLAMESRDAFVDAPTDSQIWDSEGRSASAPQRICGGEKLPFLLMQRPSGLDRGLGAGWDVVVSRGWGRPLWQSIMYANGARAAGMTEWRHFALEQGDRIFPDDFPDSRHANRALHEKEKELAERYERRPKSKRVNYGLYRVQSPFFPDLDAIVTPPTPPVVKATSTIIATDNVATKRPKKRQRFQTPENSTTVQDIGEMGAGTSPTFGVLRSRKELRAALGHENGASRFGQRKYVEVGVVERKMRTLALEQTERNSFVRATVRPMGRGTAIENAIICAPSTEDLSLLALGKFVEMKEKLRRKGDEQASRSCIGRVVYGNFSMARGGPIAVAFLKTDEVQKLSADARAVPRARRGGRDTEGVQVKVLVRNIDSLQYRLAVATVTW